MTEHFDLIYHCSDRTTTTKLPKASLKDNRINERTTSNIWTQKKKITETTVFVLLSNCVWPERCQLDWSLDVGTMTVICPFCRAMFFEDETKTCCRQADITIVLFPKLIRSEAELPEHCQYVDRLWRSSDSFLSNEPEEIAERSIFGTLGCAA